MKGAAKYSARLLPWPPFWLNPFALKIKVEIPGRNSEANTPAEAESWPRLPGPETFFTPVPGLRNLWSEQVAQEAVQHLLAFQRSGAALDEHLADQLILPLALCGHPAVLSTERISEHTRTNLWVVEQFFGPVAKIEPENNLIRLYGD